MNQNQLNYIFKNFSLIYDFNDFDNLDLIFSNNSNNNSKIVIIEGEKTISINPVFSEWNESSIPFLFNTEVKPEIITKKETQIIINYDILSPIFYMLSGKQEIDIKEKDDYGRFEYRKSLQYKFNFTETPIVNYYFDILKTAIELANEIKIKPKHSFTTCLTHDIDEVDSAWKHRIRNDLNKKNVLKAIGNFTKHLLKPFYPWRNLSEIIKTEKQYSVKSTFFFLTNNKKIDKIKNADYELKSNYIQKQLKKINENNCEIGIHGSYKTHVGQDNLTKEITILNRNIKGNRFHFLQWDMKSSPNVIEENELLYDSTLGFQEQIGFRNGICNPFYLYNFESEKAYNFLEIPLSIMDCSLAFENYMNTTPDKTEKTIQPMINEIKKFGGVLTINWHNTFVSDYLYSSWKEVYFGIIKTCKQQGSNFETCIETSKKYKF